MDMVDIEKLISKAVLSVTLLPAYEDSYDPEKILKSWEVTSFTSEKMKIQLYFTQ